ncbi:recombination protein RecR [Candidatus Fermentibacterales bacterium]|nr:recombination protein RecR [Candidatus Fermentibacterales bacterium]
MSESDGFEDLVGRLSSLPGIGRKTALRLAFHLLGHRELAADLASAIGNAVETIHRCESCRNLTEEQLCEICRDSGRRERICVVETPADLRSIEEAGLFRGRYFVLHGLLAPLDGIGPSDLGVDLLRSRIEEGGIEEIILALDSTAEGDATAVYLSRALESAGVLVTRLARGLPPGAAVEFADSLTLTEAFQGRRKV